MLALVVVAVLASPETPGLTIDTVIGFGVAAPVVSVFAWLMFQANKARDAAQAAHLEDLRAAVPAIVEATAAQRAMAAALNTLTEEHRRFLRDQTLRRGGP